MNVSVEVTSVKRTYGRKRRESKAFDLRLFRDDQLVGYVDGALELDAKSKKATYVLGGIRVSHTGPEEVTISAYAFNSDRVKSETHRVVYEVPGETSWQRGTAYVICIGIDAFDDPKWDLHYAAADARALSKTLQNRLSKSDTFENVVSVLVTSEKARRGATKRDVETVLRLLAGRPVAEQDRRRIAGAERIKEALPGDFLLISVSTHGHTDERGDFYLLPSDAKTGPEWLASCISATELAHWLRDVDAGDMVMILDACHSAASTGAGFRPAPIGDRNLGQLAYNKRMRLLAASQAAEVALEDSTIRHGLLTYALIQDGLEKGRADFQPEDKRIMVGEWLQYAARRVPRLAQEIAEGKARAVGFKGVAVPRTARRIAQHPRLFDFAQGREAIILALRK